LDRITTTLVDVRETVGLALPLERVHGRPVRCPACLDDARAQLIVWPHLAVDRNCEIVEPGVATRPVDGDPDPLERPAQCGRRLGSSRARGM
jgi:hypothetical protein